MALKQPQYVCPIAWGPTARVVALIGQQHRVDSERRPAGKPLLRACGWLDLRQPDRHCAATPSLHVCGCGQRHRRHTHTARTSKGVRMFSIGGYSPPVPDGHTDPILPPGP